MEIAGRSIVLAALGAVAFLAMITVNVLANTIPINGNTTGALSDAYPNLFVPAGFTFSVWGVIYLLLAVFVFQQLIAAIQTGDLPAGSLVNVLFIVSCVLNGAWIFAWHYKRLVVSLLVMFALLASLIVAYLVLTERFSTGSSASRTLLLLPIRVYLGWITVATVANTTAMLVSFNWNGFGLSDSFWAAVMIVVAFAIALLALFVHHDVAFALVVVWALVGIVAKRAPAVAIDSPCVLVTAAACGGVLLVSVIFTMAGILSGAQ